MNHIPGNKIHTYRKGYAYFKINDASLIALEIINLNLQHILNKNKLIFINTIMGNINIFYDLVFLKIFQEKIVLG